MRGVEGEERRGMRGRAASVHGVMYGWDEDGWQALEVLLSAVEFFPPSLSLFLSLVLLA